MNHPPKIKFATNFKLYIFNFKPINMKRNLLIICLMALSSFAIAQTGTIKGRVLDPETNEALIGANAVISGTTQGATTDVDGYFTIENVKAGSVKVNISFIGYGSVDKTVTVVAGQTVQMGEITLDASSIGLKEIEVIASVAIDRKTPIAVSTVKSQLIESKIGSQEFPEILKSTPGVFATKTGGGYGDGRINVRGFSDENVAVLINGIPVNDMENGHVYWSNWTGLTDAASSIQVQRGLGASKVAVPSVGGTINILSKASDLKKGGYFQFGTGNNNYSKLGFSLSSGLSENGWAFTLSGSRIKGDGYIDGTQFDGYSYFANLTKTINKHHQLGFTVVGAKQTHGQRYNYISLEDMEKSPQGRKLNYDWGYKNGQVVNLAYNFYHKPQLSLNHYWTISDKTELSTAVYASFGNGGGRRAQGNLGGSVKDLVRTGGKYGPVDLDYYVAQNEASTSGEAASWIAASHNSHSWYGVLSSLNHEINENLTLLAGIDLRYYKGKHYYEVTDLLGGDYILRSEISADRGPVVRHGGHYNKDYDGNVLWNGLFAQLEYSLNKLSAFVSLAGSNTGYRKDEFLVYEKNDPKNVSETVNYLGYQVKGGVNYNLTDHHNIYVNGGYLTKAPVWDNVFALGDRSTEVNKDAANEDILTVEVGYGLRTTNLVANLNVYSTTWMNRALQVSQTGTDGQIYFANILGVDALHQGVEFDVRYSMTPKLNVSGMLTLQDNTWQNDVENVYILDQDGNRLQDDQGNDLPPYNYYMSGLRVGNAAQTTAALGFDYTLTKGLSFGMDFNYYDNLYASFSPTSATSETDKVQSWRIPAYGLLDFNIAYDFEIAGMKSSLYGNINNIANTKYVADAISQDGLYSGFGTTWTLTAKVKF